MVGGKLVLGDIQLLFLGLQCIPHLPDCCAGGGRSVRRFGLGGIGVQRGRQFGLIRLNLRGNGADGGQRIGSIAGIHSRLELLMQICIQCIRRHMIGMGGNGLIQLALPCGKMLQLLLIGALRRLILGIGQLILAAALGKLVLRVGYFGMKRCQRLVVLLLAALQVGLAVCQFALSGSYLSIQFIQPVMVLLPGCIQI